MADGVELPSARALIDRLADLAGAERPVPPGGHDSAADLEWPAVLAELAGFCRTELGAELAHRLPELNERGLVERRLREVEQAKALVQADRAPGLAGLVDVREALERASRGGILDGHTLLAVANAARISDETSRALGRLAPSAPLLAELATQLRQVEWLAVVINDAVETDGTLKDTASPDLGELRERARQLDQALRKRVERVLLEPELEPYLQDRFFTLRDGRYVLPIKVSEGINVPGIVHGRSGSGQTLFVEPTELVDANNRLKVAELAVEAEELRILEQLSADVGTLAEELRGNLQVLSYLDLTLAAGRLADCMRATRAELATDAAIDLRRARHPLLALREARSEGKFRVIPNDIRFGEGVSIAVRPSEEDGEADAAERPPRQGPVLVVSGPNTGGKTVTLKTLGLASLMTRGGLLFPAEEGSRLPLFQRILADIGDEQSLAENLSSFSAHIANIKEFLPLVSAGTLVLMDELFSGTDPVQGAALGVALLEAMADRGALVVVTTHSQPLKRYALANPRFVNASMGFDLSRLEPTYELHLGLPGSSHALGIAKRMGLDEAIVRRAAALLAGEDEPVLERTLQELEVQRRRLAEQRQAAVRARAAAEDEAKQLQRERQRLQQAALREADERLAGLFRLIDESEQRLKQHRERFLPPRGGTQPTAAEVEAGAAELRTLRSELQQVREGREQQAAAAVRPPLAVSALVPGMAVWVRSLRRSGVLTEIDPARGQAWVQLGRLKTTVALTDLHEPAAQDMVAEGGRPAGPSRIGSIDRLPSPPVVSPAQGEDEEDVFPPQHPGNTADLRGHRVEEALALLDQHLDSALRRQEPALWVIHGHGTGALKAAVRQHLGASPYAKAFRPGDRKHGGDGVTLVELK